MQPRGDNSYGGSSSSGQQQQQEECRFITTTDNGESSVEYFLLLDNNNETTTTTTTDVGITAQPSIIGRGGTGGIQRQQHQQQQQSNHHHTTHNLNHMNNNDNNNSTKTNTNNDTEVFCFLDSTTTINNNNNNNNNNSNNQEESSRSTFPSTTGNNNYDNAMVLMNRARTETELTTDEEEVIALYPTSSSHQQLRRNGGFNNNNSNNAQFIRRRNYNHQQRHRIELNGLNYLNFVTYICNLFVSWGVGVWGLHHIVWTRWEVTIQYETLVTPSEWASFYVLALIVILESIFTIAQLVPYYRGRSIIQAGTRFYFFYTVLCQTAWTLLYCFELLWLSYIAMVGTLLSLVMLLHSQEQHNSYSSTSSSSTTVNLLIRHNSDSLLPNSNYDSNNTNDNATATTSASIIRTTTGGTNRHLTEYFLFRFPFYLHTGWMVCLTATHFSLLFRAYTPNDIGLQISMDIIALAIMLPIATYTLMRYDHPDFVIPVVILISYLGIASRLCHPSDAMIDLYGDIVIHAFRYASWILAGIVTCCIVPNMVIWFARELCTINVVELD